MRRSVVLPLVVLAMIAASTMIHGIGTAATHLVTTEAESGVTIGNADVTDDGTASGDRSVRFGGTSDGGGATGCTSSGQPAPCIGGPATGAGGWGALVFGDEFDGTSLDTAKWAPCWYPESFTGDRCGTMNESVTDKRNVAVGGGAAVLTQAARDSGALINSDPDAGAGTGFMMGAGFAEARVYFAGSGTTVYNWPAWWINGPESGYGDGEIDVAEGLGSMTSNYHYDRGSGHVANNSGTIPGTWAAGWHTYGVHRKAGENIIYYDGREVRRYPTYDNLAPESLIFNIGTKESRTMVFGPQSQMRVDYVRVWRSQ